MIRQRFFWPRLVLLCTILLAPAALAADDLEHHFDTVWRLIDERYWNLDVIPADWDEVGDRYRPLVQNAADEDEYYSLMEQMYAEIADDHSVFVPPARVEEIRSIYGDMACVALLGQAELDGLAGTISYGLVQLEPQPVGMIRVPDLASDFVNSNVREAIRELHSQGAAALILDLRGNPGGRLLSMMQVAGAFTSGFLWRLVTTWSLLLPYPAIGQPETDLPLAILIDGNVHSAAEGLAGALRQSGRARTFGQATAGNVEALLPFCLRDGSQAWVAAGVLAPLGAPTWQNVGVAADHETEPAEAEAAALEWLNGLLAD